MNPVIIGKQSNMMTKKLQTCVMTTLLTYQGGKGTQSRGTGRKKNSNHTSTPLWQTHYTLHQIKSVILPLININIWQKLINRSFAMLIYQAEYVGPPSIFGSIIHLSIQPTHNSLQKDAHSRIFSVSPGQGTWRECFLWLMIVIFHVKV